MTRKPRIKTDLLEIERALSPGIFIPDRACSSFVSGLDEVAVGIAKLGVTDPSRAVGLYETFLAGCYEKAEELDDSSGSFGQCVDELFCGWIKARQAGVADPDETATRLLGWMDDDPYGFCYHIERDAAKVFDKAGLAAFAKQVRARFDGAVNAKPTADGSPKDRPENILRHWGETLRTLYLAQNDSGETTNDPVAKKAKQLNPKVQAWFEARERHHLSHAQIQMARELGMNPAKLGKLDNHTQERWKLPLPRFIEELYLERFGKTTPEIVMSIEERVRLELQKREARRAAKQQRATESG